MKWNVSVIVVLVCLSIPGMMVTGCDTPTGGETDTWTNVTSLDQLNGTWNGLYSQSMTFKEAIEAMEGNEVPWDSEMETLFGGIKAAISADLTLTLNASAKTQSSFTIMTQTYSGGNITAAWAMISAFYSDQPDFTVDNEKHSITMTQDSPVLSISDEDIDELLNRGFQTNQNGTKIRIPNFMGEGSPELILTKRNL
jgi:hypothetical protein